MAEFTLTSGAERIRGTSSDDTITGGAGTLSSRDAIRGGGGEDTLIAGVVQNGTQAPRIEGVENLFLDTGGLAFDISNIRGAERIVADGASTTFTGIESGDFGIRFGARDVESGTVELDLGDALGDEVLRLEAIRSNVTFKAPTLAGNESVREVDLVLAGTRTDPAQEGFSVQVDLSDFALLETLTLSGDATSKIVVDSPELARIDARETTGGITVASDIAGAQTVIGGAGDDDVTTGAGSDTLRLRAGDDTVKAGAGDNDVRLGAGDDTFESEGGADTVRGGSGADDIKSGGGADDVEGGGGADVIDAEGGDDIVSGGGGADEIDGGNGADTIRDGAGADVVRGGGGADTLIAGRGDDVFDGGAGADTFDFVTNANLGDDQVGDANKFAVGEDEALLLVGGTQYAVSTQEEWRTLDREQDDLVVVDSGAQQVRVDIDNGGIVTFNVDDADFFEMG